MSVYQDKNGQWWAAVESGYTRTGGRRRVRRQATSEKQAKRLHQEMLLDRRQGILTVGKGITVKAWAQTWITEQINHVRPSTWNGYKVMVGHATESIGDRTLERLTPADIHTFTKFIRARGVGSTSVRDNQSRLQRMLRDARAAGHVVPDSPLAVRLPSRAPTDRTAIPTDEILAVLAKAIELWDGSRWVAAILQGMRQAECLGLTWRCVDLDRGLIDVSWQLKAVRFRHGCSDDAPTCGRKYGGDCPQREYQVPDDYEFRVVRGALCLVRPKTSRGKRVIPMTPWLTAALQQWKDIAPASPHGLVWPTIDGQPRDDTDDAQQWYDLQSAARVARFNEDTGEGRRYFTHEARNSTATLLLEQGIDPHTVTAILGHSSITTSRGYQTVSEELARRAMDAVAANLQLTLPSAPLAVAPAAPTGSGAVALPSADGQPPQSDPAEPR